MAGKISTFLAGVADATGYAGTDLLFEARALTDSSISIGVTPEEIRGGQGAQLIGRYFHTSTFGIELTDALFQLDYIALNVGSKIDPAGIGELVTEEVTAGSQQLVITGTATDFMGEGILGWYSLPGEDEWTTITFGDDGKTAPATGVTAGTVYCVKYMNDATCDMVTINANFIPDEITLILKAGLFKGSKGTGVDTKSRIGTVEIEVPRFQLNGTMDLTLNMTGAAQTPLSGQALATDGVGCDGAGYYARIKKITLDAVWTDNLKTIAASPGSLSIPSGGNAVLQIYGVFKGNTMSKLISPSDLTYTVTPTSGLASVVNGVVTAETVSAEQKGTITVTIKGATGSAAAISTTVPVTVTTA